MINLEIEVLFDISLSVGVTLDIDESAHEFLSRCVKSLNRTAGAIVRHNAGNPASNQILKSIPRSFARHDEFSQILRHAQPAIQTDAWQHYRENVNVRHTQLSYDIFEIPGIGSLVLYGKPLDVSIAFYGHFNLILKKFAASCHACDLQAENKQQSRRLELATKAAKIGTWELDIESGVLLIDDRIRELFGVEQYKYQFTLDEFFDYVHEEDKALVVAHVRNYISQCVDEPTEYYYRILRKEGDIRKLAANATLLFDGDKPTTVVGVNYDITEAELARTQSMYRSELESLLVSLSVDLIKNRYVALDQVINNALQKAGEFVEADRAYRFEYDFDNETTSNTHEWCSDGITPEKDNLQDIPINEIRLWVTAHRAGLPFFIKSVQELPKDHSLREILEPQGIRSLVTIPLMNEDNCVGFIGFDAVKHERLWTDVDLTLLRLLADLLVNADVRIQHEAVIGAQNLALTNARDHAEILAHEANEANAAKSRFVARVSHEIRTPLHAILGLSDLVLAEKPTSYVQELTTTIRESGSILLDLINDVLDFSKAESNEVVLNMTDFRLTDLLTSLESMFRPLAERKNLGFEISISPSVNPAYHGDRLRIRQVVTNLLSNAIKFTSSGAVKIDIDSRKSDIEWLIIKVTDSGMGIPDGDREKLFQPFFQSANTDSLMLTGTGLGLTISRALTDRMGGHITVDSRLGVGSSFSLELPLKPVSPVYQSQTEHKSHASTSRTDAISILVAEDNPVNIQLIKAYLKDVPGELVCVTDGQQAYEATLDHTDYFDIVLMDCNMPVMNGYDATRSIRASERGRSHTPIIAVTAGALEGEKDEALAAGMDDILVKPFSKNELLAMIYRHIGDNC